jgi:hypothetical protein
MATLHWGLKDAPSDLYEGARWDLLTQFILHANERNRCWPSMETLAKRLGKSTETLTKAKQWLIEHGAIALVPFSQRSDEQERSQPRRQHIYQLTGVMTFEGKTIQYLYIPGREISHSEISVAEISPVPSISSTSSKDSTNSKDSLAPQVTQEDTPPKRERPRNELFDVIAKGSFGLDDVPATQGGRIARIVRDVCTIVFTSNKPTPEQRTQLVADLAAMYAWYAKTHPDLSAPASEVTICKYLNEWRTATVKVQPQTIEVIVPYERPWMPGIDGPIPGGASWSQ